jgi:hypothetical protein
MASQGFMNSQKENKLTDRRLLGSHRKMKSLIFILLWLLLASCSSSTTNAQTVYVTKTGEKYHNDGCRHLRSKIEISLKKAIELGYGPCGVCRPPTAEAQNATSPVIKKDTKKTTPSNPIKKSATMQCSARTKSGTRCKRTTDNANGKCWQHQ